MDGKRAKKADTSEEMRQALKTSFLRLYAQQPLNKISVQQIADGAGASRGSFYYHYTDVYHLLDELEDDMIQGINASVHREELLDNVLRRARHEQPLKAVSIYLSTLDYLVQNRDAILTLDRGSHNRSFADKLRGITRDNLLVVFRTRCLPERDPSHRKYMAEYMAAGCVATYMTWLGNGMPEPPEVLAEVIMDAMAKLLAPPAVADA